MKILDHLLDVISSLTVKRIYIKEIKISDDNFFNLNKELDTQREVIHLNGPTGIINITGENKGNI